MEAVISTFGLQGDPASDFQAYSHVEEEKNDEKGPKKWEAVVKYMKCNLRWVTLDAFTVWSTSAPGSTASAYRSCWGGQLTGQLLGH
jgi:hypothetical protein